MPIRFRTAEEDDWQSICLVDGRNFGFGYTPEQIEKSRAIHDPSRFELAFDGKELVAIVGAFTLQVTVPGSRRLPMGGLTWVSTAATHRRQGLLTKLMARTLADVDRRGEPVAMLGASEGGIYERYGFGVATVLRATSIDRRMAQVRPEFRPKPGSVRFVDGDEALSHVSEVWSRFHRTRAGEVDRSEAWHRFLFDVRATERDGFSPAFYLAHRDGFAVYRILMQWNNGKPAHNLDLIELVGNDQRRTRCPLAHPAGRRPRRPDHLPPGSRRRSAAVSVDQPAGAGDDHLERRRLGQRPRCQGVLR